MQIRVIPEISGMGLVFGVVLFWLPLLLGLAKS
jgi:hypothetical protein